MVMSLRGSNSKLSGKLVSYAVICAMPYSQNLLSFVFMYICVFLLYFVQYPDRLFACLISLTTSFVKDIGRGTHILCFSERPLLFPDQIFPNKMWILNCTTKRTCQP